MSAPRDTPLVGQWGDYRRRRRRGPLPKWAWLCICVALAGVLGLALWLRVRPPAPWRPPSGSPHFASCTYGGYVDGWCSVVAVPLDPLQPQGRTLALNVTVLPATRKPAQGALFYLEGGPGLPATASAIRVNALFAQVGRTRDLVMVDARGMGGASRITCPGGAVRAGDAAAVTAFVERCFARVREGARLDTTSVAAADLDAVRRELGYGKIDVYGASYGATLAQAYARAFPQSVRTLVLDSGSLPNVRLYDAEARNAQHALDVDLARCGRPCAHTNAELTQLLEHPPRGLTSADVAWTVATLSETAESAATIPAAVHLAVRGNTVPLRRAFADQVGPYIDARTHLAAVWEILCSEPWARFDASVGGGSYLDGAALERARMYSRACLAVPKGRVPANAAAIVPLHMPTLLLAGGADPLDPVANLNGWRRAFTNARLVVVPGAGHGVMQVGCVPAVVAQFVSRGSAAGLDARCVDHVHLPTFETG
jgi:pimeloyl-ACP methyl ester carboxylesterase